MVKIQLYVSLGQGFYLLCHTTSRANHLLFSESSLFILKIRNSSQMTSIFLLSLTFCDLNIPCYLYYLLSKQSLKNFNQTLQWVWNSSLKKKFSNYKSLTLFKYKVTNCVLTFKFQIQYSFSLTYFLSLSALLIIKEKRKKKIYLLRREEET